MSREFHQAPKGQSPIKYFLWVLLIVAGALFVAFFFVAGARELHGTAQAWLAITQNSKPTPIAEAKNFKITDENGTTEVLGALTRDSVENETTPSNLKFGEGYGKGLTMFRGNPSRSWYGTGPLPDNPRVLWRYPDTAMCSESSDKGVVKTWCGSGWTGQPVVWERPDGITEVIFGAYDKNVHFVNAETGKDTRPPFKTGDIIKGSVTLDPDGFPLLYFGSRDNKVRVVALDRDVPTELWSLDTVDVPGIWNNDWDSNPIIRDDLMFEGGEQGWFFVIKLNRTYSTNGKVSVSPKIIFKTPSYDDALIAKVGDNNLGIENSVAMFGNNVYFANSGGRVMGLDISNVENGIAPLVFDYWMGDDVDASIVIDDEGMLYVSSEKDRLNARAETVGQLVKLDPSKPENPRVWGVSIPAKVSSIPGGIWATPAIYKGFVYTATNPGEFLAVDRMTGEVTYRDNLNPHAWSSPIIADGELMVTTCDGRIRKYSLENPAKPTFLSEFNLPSGSCIESTPALWDSNLYVGARDGYFYAIGD